MNEKALRINFIPSRFSFAAITGCFFFARKKTADEISRQRHLLSFYRHFMTGVLDDFATLLIGMCGQVEKAPPRFQQWSLPDLLQDVSGSVFLNHVVRSTFTSEYLTPSNTMQTTPMHLIWRKEAREPEKPFVLGWS